MYNYSGNVYVPRVQCYSNCVCKSVTQDTTFTICAGPQVMQVRNNHTIRFRRQLTSRFRIPLRHACSAFVHSTSTASSRSVCSKTKYVYVHNFLSKECPQL